MKATIERQAALEEFLRLPEIEPPLEFYTGRITQKMSPKLVHVVIQGELLSSLNAHSRPGKMGRAFSELRVVFGGISMVPDLSSFAEDRMPDVTSPVDRENVRFAPRLVIEIVSPRQNAGELGKKIRTALRAGVKLGWLIDEDHRQVLVMRPGKEARTLEAGDILCGEEILPAYSLPLDEIFGWIGPP